MSHTRVLAAHSERLIAALLRCGTWVASTVIGLGILSSLLGDGGVAEAKTGIALFILLPIARVVLMLAIFVRERDHIYTAISGLVLAIIMAGIFAGM